MNCTRVSCRSLPPQIAFIYLVWRSASNPSVCVAALDVHEKPITYCILDRNGPTVPDRVIFLNREQLEHFACHTLGKFFESGVATSEKSLTNSLRRRCGKSILARGSWTLRSGRPTRADGRSFPELGDAAEALFCINVREFVS